MEIDDKLMEKLSQLSALCFDPEEARQMKEYLKDTLSHFEKIKKLDTKAKGHATNLKDSQRAADLKNTAEIQGFVNPLFGPCILREDREAPFPDKEKLLEQAPNKQGALVKAPSTV